MGSLGVEGCAGAHVPLQAAAVARGVLCVYTLCPSPSPSLGQALRMHAGRHSWQLTAGEVKGVVVRHFVTLGSCACTLQMVGAVKRPCAAQACTSLSCTCPQAYRARVHNLHTCVLALVAADMRA